jgi:aspartate 1-decarboxylase
MQIKMFKSKIHRATLTGANLDYEGSIKVDSDLLDASNIFEYEAVWIWNINNGNRLMTYALRGDPGTGIIELNGSAARLGHKGDLVIISTFADMTPLEAKEHKPIVVLVDGFNKVKSILNRSGGLE